MNLTDFSLRRTRVIAISLLAFGIMGMVAFVAMPRNDMPPYTIRFVPIVTEFPGASPTRVESLITDPLEEIVQELPELKNVTSESRTGLSVITVEVRQDVPAEQLQSVWDRLRRKINVASRTLPEGAGQPEVKDDSLGVVYGIVIGLQNDGFSYDELENYAEALRNKILEIDDAAEVEFAGVQEGRVYIDYDPDRLASVGLTATGLQQTIAATNILYPGGSVVLGDERVILEPSGNFGTLAELQSALIPLPGGGTIRLDDITTVSRGYLNPAKSLVRINGKPGISMSVAVRKGANLIRLGEKVDALMHRATQDLPIGISVFRVASQDEVVEKSIADFLGNLLQAMGVVLGVMLVMLGLRTGLVVASLIPMTMLLTLFFMSTLGQGLNQVSLAGLIMALGMLVDNAIVMSEAIVVEMERGVPPSKAAVRASSELAGPLLISSLTTSAAFLAFFLAESLMGDIVGPLFVVISVALLSSWLLSLTLIPLLVVAFVRIKVKQGGAEIKEGRVFAAIRGVYRPSLEFCLRHRAAVVVATLVLFIGSCASFGKLPFIFFPDSERALVQVDINLPQGTRIESTDAAVAKIEAFIDEKLSKEVVDTTAFIGEGPASYDLGYQPGEGNSSYVHLLVNTASGDANQIVIDKINKFGIERLPNAVVSARRLAGGGGGVPVEVRIFGGDPAQLYQIGERLKKHLVDVPGSRNVTDNWGPRLKKFRVDIKPNQLRAANLTNQDVAVSLQTVLTGFKTGEFRDESDSIPITMRADDATGYTMADIRNVAVHPMRGGVGVPLSQVADVVLDWQYPRVRRRNLTRMYAVQSYLENGYTATDLVGPITDFMDADKKAWPDDYRYELGGESEQSDEGMSSIGAKLPLGFAIIILLLVVQFNSVRKTFIVLCTVPLGVIGVILGLHLFRSYFGFFAFLGIISLAGIVINNAIVLIDRIRIEIDDNGCTTLDGIRAACQHRLRPILLTTLTTTLGLVPLYLGGGVMWEPMAVSIMCGLLFATLITLVFIPVLYSLLFRTGSGGAKVEAK